MFGLTMGKEYPETLVDLWQSAKVNKQIYNRDVTSVKSLRLAVSV